jgi:hypothetical protein
MLLLILKNTDQPSGFRLNRGFDKILAEGRKGKPLRDAAHDGDCRSSDDHKALRKIAAALLGKRAGDVQAINALADRTDGKVAHSLIGKMLCGFTTQSCAKLSNLMPNRLSRD